jgi:protein-S-isoprenylcysteine O-methyltransferase Ste14
MTRLARAPNPRLLRALTAFLLLPGTAAYLVPLLIASRPEERTWHWAGLPLLAAGTALLLWTVRDFYVAGRGTLAPWAPPERLVTTGLYRISRNPMYLAVVLVVLGWAAWFGSAPLIPYAAALAVAFHLRVLLHEEPHLERAFGDAWRSYRRRVPRWLGRPAGETR